MGNLQNCRRSLWPDFEQASLFICAFGAAEDSPLSHALEDNSYLWRPDHNAWHQFFII
jgi:hypothetical protein